MSEHNADLKRISPNLSLDELAEAKALLDAYLLLAWDIGEDNSTQGNHPQLTHGSAGSTMQVKVDSPHTN